MAETPNHRINRKSSEYQSLKDWPEILTPRQVDALLRVHERTVTNLAKRKELPGFQVGNQWRFKRDTILGLIP